MNALLPFDPRAGLDAGRHGSSTLFWYITIVTGGRRAGRCTPCCCTSASQYRRGGHDRLDARASSARTGSNSPGPIIPLIIFLTFFGWGACVFNHAVHPPADAMEIFVIGKQWMWKAQYPNGQRVIIGGNPRNMTEDGTQVDRPAGPAGQPAGEDHSPPRT